MRLTHPSGLNSITARTRLRRRCFVGVALAATGLALGCAVASAAETVPVEHASTIIRLDGRLDEPAWQGAHVLSLTQQSPWPGRPTPYVTEVRVLISGDTLYIGFECLDPSPGAIAIHTLQRDGDLTGDDTVSMVLDTFGDRRTGYFFQVNAGAARVDGLISGPKAVSLDWDGIWDARTARTAKGWTAEIALPASTLSFTRGLATWGLNLERFIARDRTTLRWASPTLDSFLYDLSRAGSLAGVEGVRQGLGVELNPYVSARTNDDFRSGRAYDGTGGADLSWHIAPQMTAVATVNTDFAESEVDARQINITRFPLFFPEKRAFFLEGLNGFAFGLGLNKNAVARYGIGNAFLPFFTRRIGLHDGQQVPIGGGVKLTGRAGRWNVGVLDVQTREGAGVPAVNLLGGRLSYDVNEKLQVGTLVTNGDPESFHPSTLVAFDSVWRTSTFRHDKNLLVGAWAAVNAAHTGPDRRGWGLEVEYPNDNLDCEIGTNRFGEDLSPALGFLPRPGTRWYQGGCVTRFRPAEDGKLRRIRLYEFEAYYSRITNVNGTNETSRYFASPVSTTFTSGEHLEINVAHDREFLAKPFAIADGVSAPPGAYTFTRGRILFQTSKHRPLQVGSTTWMGSFYGGRLTQWDNYVKLNALQGRLQLGVTTTNNFGRVRAGRFVQRLWQAQSGFAFTPQLILSTFIQYDNQSHNVGANTRLRWTIRPGDDLFVVWNRGWQRVIAEGSDLSLVPQDETIAIKLRWTIRR